MTSTMQKIHYASYEKKKGTGKKQKLNLILILLVLLLAGRNRILQVPRSSATDT